MIKVALGVLVGIGIATTFPDQTADLSEYMRGKINQGAQIVVEQTDTSTLARLKECAAKGIADCK